MGNKKEQLSEKQLEAQKLICNPFGYRHTMDRARRYLTNPSPEYSYARTEEFVDALLDKLINNFN